MKMNALWLGMALPLAALAQSVEIKTDRESSVYTCGEPASFSVLVLGKDKQPVKEGQLRVTLTNFGTQQVASATVDLAKSNPATCAGTLRAPGFLKCTAYVKVGTNDCRGLCGAAYEPEKIRAGSERPADFDAFWTRPSRSSTPRCRRSRAWSGSTSSAPTSTRPSG